MEAEVVEAIKSMKRRKAAVCVGIQSRVATGGSRGVGVNVDDAVP
jgi:hypothetical protein